MRESGCEAHAYKCDVTQYGDVKRVAGEVRRDLGNVDILVNNAGVVYVKDIFDLEEKEIRKTFDVNTISHFWVSHTVVHNVFLNPLSLNLPLSSTSTTSREINCYRNFRHVVGRDDMKWVTS